MKPLHVLCALAFATQLAACGGGSSGGTTTPPQSSNPPTSNPPTNNPPVATTVKLTLKGAVTDDPIPNALVTATIGGQTFTTTADASGNYTLQVEVEQANAGNFVTLSAKGAGARSYVEFTSLVGSLSSLVTQAGTDGTLSNNENFSTQITNVSTAQAVLLKEANGGKPITSNTSLQDLGSSIDGQAVLDLATAIKLSVDDPTNYPLPQGQTSILAIASDATVRKQFIDTAYSKDKQVFASTQTAVAQDPDLSPSLTAAAVPTSITAAMLSTDPTFTFNFADRVSKYTFNADGTGRATSTFIDQPTTWALDGANIKVTYGAPVETVSYDTENCAGLVRQVEAHYHSEGVKLTMLSSRTLAITETNDITYADCPSLQAKHVTTTTARTILADDDFAVIEPDNLTAVAHAVNVYDTVQNAVVADIVKFEANGTGTTHLLNKTFTWAFDSTKRIFTATFNDGAVIHYRVLRDLDEMTGDVFYEGTAGDRHFAGAGVAVDLEPGSLTFTNENVVGRFYQWGVGDEATPDPRLKGFRFRIDAGGVGAQENDYINEQDQLVTVDETVDPFAAFKWQLSGEDLVLTKTFVYSADPDLQAPSCELGTTDCGVADVRRIVPLASLDNRVYVLEKRQMDYRQPVTADTRATYLIRYYDKEPATGAAKSIFTQALRTSTGSGYVPHLQGASLH